MTEVPLPQGLKRWAHVLEEFAQQFLWGMATKLILDRESVLRR